MKDILLATVDSIAGHSIIKYCGFVSARIVVGTDVLSEFVASFTDFFGGRSNTLERELNTLFEYAMDQIKSKAVRLNANAVIGMRSDIDQISGKGTFMFAITVSGTAVELDKSTIKEERREEENQKQYVMRRKVEQGLVKAESAGEIKDLLDKSRGEGSKVGLGILFSNMNRVLGDNNNLFETDATLKSIVAYMSSYPSLELIEQSHHFLINGNEHLNDRLKQLLAMAFNGLKDYDPGYLATVLDRIPMYLWGLGLLRVIAEASHEYSKAERGYLIEIQKRIEREPPVVAKPVKGLFSSGSKTCICGGTISSETCERCFRDASGFRIEDRKLLEDARRTLRLTLSWLDEQ